MKKQMSTFATRDLALSTKLSFDRAREPDVRNIVQSKTGATNMQNTKSKTWGARRKGLTLLFLSLTLSFFPLSYSFISRTVGMHRNVLYDMMWQVPLLSTQQEMHKQAAIKSTTFCGLQNPRYKLDGVSSIKGYKAVRPPSWYTGYVSRGFVREHILLVCEKFGWTQLPKGYEVHHIDMNKLNNDINNLAVLTKSEHAKVHNQYKEWKDAQGKI